VTAAGVGILRLFEVSGSGPVWASSIRLERVRDDDFDEDLDVGERERWSSYGAIRDKHIA